MPNALEASKSIAVNARGSSILPKLSSHIASSFSPCRSPLLGQLQFPATNRVRSVCSHMPSIPDAINKEAPREEGLPSDA